MKSTLFLNKITAIDHALIIHDGRAIGGSVHLSCWVIGEVIGDESVVVDFSKIKKEIKTLIDDPEDGYDHKLWVVDGRSLVDSHEVGDHHCIRTRSCNLILPPDAVKIIKNPHNLSDLYEVVTDSIQDYLTESLKKIHPNLDISVKAFVDFDPFLPSGQSDWTKVIQFSYLHGLRFSSSNGCQNICHGHKSFVEMLGEDLSPIFIEEMVEDFSDYHYLFISESNLILDENSSDDWVKTEYTTERGYFRADYKKGDYRFVFLPTETTVEHLVEWFTNRYRNRMKEHGVKYVMMSEGLTKGSLIEI